MIDRLSAAWRALKAGEALRESILLKRAQLGASIGALLVSLVALAKTFGIDIPLTETELMQIGGTFGLLFGVFNYYTTAASTDKIDGLGRTAPSFPVSKDHPQPDFYAEQRERDSQSS